jgi:hypothetical protein
MMPQAPEAWEHSLGFDSRRDQAGGRPRPAQTTQGYDDRHYFEGDGLAAALGPRLLCGVVRNAPEVLLEVSDGDSLSASIISIETKYKGWARPVS